MLAFPMGGVAAGSLALGGRGQLRDWEIFNRPNKGFSPQYAFPSIWIKTGHSQPITRVLEARILPPYEGQDGLGSNNSPGLSRIATAEFTAQYPLAHLQFKDPTLPVKIELDAFSPFIPHDADASGLLRASASRLRFPLTTRSRHPPSPTSREPTKTRASMSTGRRTRWKGC
jgi:non-lysosomal glucosylceramidase